MSSTTELQQDALGVLNAAPDNYLVLLPDPPRFTIVGVTDCYLQATFTKREDILGKGLFEGFPDNPQQSGATGVKNLRTSVYYVLETRQEHRMADQRYDVPNPKGEGFVFKVWRPLNKPVFNDQGEVQYIIHTVADVTALAKAKEKEVEFKSIEQAYHELKKAENALKESEERFRTMANSIPQLAWMTDAYGWIYWYNDRWYEYTGTTPEEMLGWGWRSVHHPDLVDGVVHRIKAAFESGNAWEDVFLLRSKEGEYRWFLSRALPVRKDDGTLVGWFGTNTDITEQRRTEEALEKSEEQLLLAMEGGELGYFDFDPNSGELRWSARTKALFGLPPDAPVDYNVYLNSLYPEDRERTHAAVQKAMDLNFGVYENEYRVVGPNDGRLRWLRSKGKTFFDAQGKAGLGLSICKKIIERHAGTIVAKSMENEGTTFEILLPVKN